MEKMTSKERVVRGLNHQDVDRIPFSLGFGVNIPAKIDLQEYLELQNLQQVDEYLNSFNDLRWVEPKYCGPSNRNFSFEDCSTVDIWGVARKPVSYARNGFYEEIFFYPLAGITDISQLDSHIWPTAQWWDAKSIRNTIGRLNNGNEYAIVAGNGNIFETSWYMRGFEQMLMDLIAEPELAWEIMTRVTDYFIAYFEKLLQAAEGMIDIVFTADDIGQQEGLLLSLDLWERMIKPHHKRLNKVLHEYGVKIMYHSDGAVMQAVPGLIDMGIDILEAIQFDAKGMDPEVLKSEYGDRLCFHGGVSIQKTLPFGTVDEVRKEVKNRIRILGKNGGYILAPSHAIQAGTPAENIVAFLEESRR